MVEEKNIYEMSGTVSHLQRFLSLTFTIFSFNCSTVLLQKVKKTKTKSEICKLLQTLVASLLVIKENTIS